MSQSSRNTGHFCDSRSRVRHISTTPWNCPRSKMPRVFTKVMEAALVALRERGVRVLNYLDNWLILEQSHEQLCAHRDLVHRHLNQLGLWVSWEKRKLVSMQRISFPSMELDSVNHTAHLTQECAQSVLNCLKTLSGRMVVPLTLFHRLLGHMAVDAATVPLSVVHMRPFQHGLHGQVPRRVWNHCTPRVQITPGCRITFSPWTDPSFLPGGVPLEQVSRHSVVLTDASATSWEASHNRHAVSGVWMGSPTALAYQLFRVTGSTPCPEPPQMAPLG